jgi:hypothetical protein
MKQPRVMPIVLLLAAVCAAQQASTQPPAGAGEASSAEWQQKADEASGRECAKLSMRVAQHALEDADHLFRGGDTQAAHREIDVSLHYVQRAVDCTVQSRKREKEIEIELRAFIRRMDDLARTLDSEDRQHLKQVRAELENERDRLLRALFGAAADNSERAPQ